MRRPPLSAWLTMLAAAGLILTAPAQARQTEPSAPGSAAAPAPTPAPVPPRVDAVFAADGVTITDGGRPVLFYRTKPADPAREPGRLNYIHPIWAPDGTVLTEDRPGDHPDQRGAFWAWPQVRVDGKPVADGWAMKGLTFHVREKRFKGDKAGGGSLVVNSDWIVNAGPELAFVARETTRVKVAALKDGARRIEVETVITARADSLALAGSDDARGYGGFSIRLARPDKLSFGSEGKAVVPAVGAVAAGPAMGMAWAREPGLPAWTVGLACKANGRPIRQWILRREPSMQNCVFPGRAPVVLKAGETLRLQSTLILRPARAR